MTSGRAIPADTLATMRANFAALEDRRVRARRKPNAVIACQVCYVLAPKGLRCNAHEAEARAAVASYPSWLAQTVAEMTTVNRRAAWRRRSAAYRQRHPERRRASVLKYMASPLATEARARYYWSPRGSDTRFKQYMRNLKARVAAGRERMATIIADTERDGPNGPKWAAFLRALA